MKNHPGAMKTPKPQNPKTPEDNIELLYFIIIIFKLKMGCDNSKPVDSTRNKHMEKRREQKALNNEIG